MTLCVSFLCVRVALAQTESTIEPTADDEPVYLLNDTNLRPLQNTDMQIQLSIPGRSVYDSNPITANQFGVLFSQLISSGEYLYTVEARGQDAQNFPTETRLVRTNLLNQERTVLTNQSGIYAFAVSPDQQRIAVSYYDGAYGVGLRRICIVEVNRSMCRNAFDALALDGGYWKDENTFINTNAAYIRILDVRTFETTEIMYPSEWFMSRATLIPNTDLLFVSGISRTNYQIGDIPQFFTFDLNTRQLTDLPYDAISAAVDPIEFVDFSPNGHYLIYGQLGPLGNLAIVEFDTGRLISQAEKVFNYGWMDNTTLVLQTDRFTPQPQIFQVDMTTGITTLIASGQQAAGTLLVSQ
jgi:dipeptidyl aminopeptidase/acylaminoacyl peptidase